MSRWALAYIARENASECTTDSVTSFRCMLYTVVTATFLYHNPPNTNEQTITQNPPENKNDSLPVNYQNVTDYKIIIDNIHAIID